MNDAERGGAERVRAALRNEDERLVAEQDALHQGIAALNRRVGQIGLRRLAIQRSLAPWWAQPFLALVSLVATDATPNSIRSEDR